MALFSPLALMRGDSARARVLRGTMMTVVNFGGSKGLRLASNLILTRILFPEAFGMMALITVFVGALEMFSDMGVNASIIQSKRGHDPEYLNTAWTVQILRGAVLYVAALLLAAPAARFYDEPMLAQLLPVATLSMLISGFTSTKEATANKKILLGRITAIGLGTQALGILVNIGMALWLQSVWGLIFGGIAANLAKVTLTHLALPGARNRLAWNWEVFWDIFHFGKYIFISSIAGFFINQGDRAILGKFVSLAELGIYNIGWLMASVPMAFNRLFGRRILFPLYAEKPPAESDENRRNIARVRLAMTGGMLMISFAFGLTGDWLIQTLYTPEYHLAGPILVLVALAGMPLVITAAYSSLLLGTGDSRSFTILLITTALVQIGLLWIGVQNYGLLGAIAAPALAVFIVYPLNVFLVRRHKGWDPVHDGLYVLLAAVIAAVVLSVHPDAVARVMTGGA
ncbi:oligosaccharide flippase family protein [uncultured Roseobacter sp.]|uniref:oligosaccharide flippase family protein n=1 Tax=uncultured Roseobacter sp. TaxID=114847 RepID=UPI002626DC18|nr:oligosaccharide flippase family protein [uncultured Roseobacter sp.]